MTYFPFKSTGFVKPIGDWWMILTCDPEIVRYYCWLAKTWGIAIEAGSRHGPHISAIKGEKPQKKFVKKWFELKGRPIRFEYSNQIRHNNYHVWVDVHCPELSELRQSLGLRLKPYHSFHLTIGRFKHNMGHESHEPRPRPNRKKR